MLPLSMNWHDTCNTMSCLKEIFNTPRRISAQPRQGFTMVELLAVIAVVSILLVAGSAALRNTPTQARKTSMDSMLSAIEQARTHAIAKRTHAVLAVVEPGDALGGNPGVQQIGLFEVTAWPDNETTDITSLDVVQVGRWQSVEKGVILIDGSPPSTPLANALDAAPITLRLSGGTREMRARVMVFHPRGGLRLPAGSAPVVLRLAEGGIRGGEAIPIRRNGNIAESTLRVGRVIARPYRND